MIWVELAIVLLFIFIGARIAVSALVWPVVLV